MCAGCKERVNTLMDVSEAVSCSWVCDECGPQAYQKSAYLIEEAEGKPKASPGINWTVVLSLAVILGSIASVAIFAR